MKTTTTTTKPVTTTAKGRPFPKSAEATPRVRDAQGRFVPGRGRVLGLTVADEATAERRARALGRCACGAPLVEAVRYGAGGSPLIASGCARHFDGRGGCAVTLGGVDYPRPIDYRPIGRYVSSGSKAIDTHALNLALELPPFGLLDRFTRPDVGVETTLLRRLVVPFLALAGMAIAFAM